MKRIPLKRQSGISIDQALVDHQLLGAALGDQASWTTWLVVLKAAYGLPLTPEQKQTFISVAGDRNPPSQRVRELWAVVGRRGGKSRMAAALADYAALFVTYHLAAGENGLVLVLAASQAQAKAVFSYCLGFIQQSPVLRQELVEATRNEIRLRSGIVIAIHSTSFRNIRGRSVLCCIADEIALWRDETSATPDIETYRAVLPALATTNGMLIGISTPYRRVGLLAQKYKDHYGQDDPDVLVVKGTSKQFNPTLSETTIAAQRQADPTGAISEWDAEFRTDVSNFLDDELIEASIDHRRPLELPPSGTFRYKAFIDPSGGRGDAYCVAIGHKQDGRLVIDCVRGKHVPVDSHSFDPMLATQDFADLCKQYRISTVTGDNFSAEWCAQAWRKCGVHYVKSVLPKSAIYLECLPLFTRGLVSLPDHAKLIKELRLLERHTHRSGKDTVDHGRGLHDDYANAVCGGLRALAVTSTDYISLMMGEDQPEPTPFQHPDTERQRQENADYHANLLRTIGAPVRLMPREDAPAMRPHALSLSDQQLKLIQQGAKFLPPEVRDFYLRNVADLLSNIKQPSDADVYKAVNAVLTATRVPVHHLGEIELTTRLSTLMAPVLVTHPQSFAFPMRALLPARPPRMDQSWSRAFTQRDRIPVRSTLP